MPGRGRGGRGRGGRGRGGRGGGGRGRGGRGRGGPGRGRGRGGSAGPAASGSDKPQMEVEKDLDINGEVKDFFIGQASFEQHYNGQEINRTRYAAALAVCMETGVEISQSECSFNCFYDYQTKFKIQKHLDWVIFPNTRCDNDRTTCMCNDRSTLPILK